MTVMVCVVQRGVATSQSMEQANEDKIHRNNDVTCIYPKTNATKAVLAVHRHPFGCRTRHTAQENGHSCKAGRWLFPNNFIQQMLEDLRPVQDHRTEFGKRGIDLHFEVDLGLDLRRQAAATDSILDHQ